MKSLLEMEKEASIYWTLATVTNGKVNTYHFETCDDLIDFFNALSGYDSYEVYEPVKAH